MSDTTNLEDTRKRLARSSPCAVFTSDAGRTKGWCYCGFHKSEHAEHDAPAAPERGEWASVPYSASEVEVIGPKELHICFLPNTPRGKQIANQIANEHNKHSTLVAQWDRLLRLLRPVTSPTACYCAVMGSEKCWHCEARELIATIEQDQTVTRTTTGREG